jgi:sulfite exporter TauE/SafE
MCAAFVLFVSRRFAPEQDRVGALAAQGWYTGGRILTYTLLGTLAGMLGSAVQAAGALVGVRRMAMAVAGGVLVAWAVAALLNMAALNGGGTTFARLGRVLKGRVPGHPFVVGLFLGLLPCGFLYSALVAAVGRGGAADGAAALALFGLGTAPALLGVSLADTLLARPRAFLNRLSQLFILAMGGWFLWRGLSG